MTLLASTNVAAHSSMCDYSLDYNIKITQEQISFNKPGGKELIFSGDKLIVGGKALRLNDEQKEASRAFQQGTRQILPKVTEIAVEGAELGVKAATLAVTSLFGEDEEVYFDLIKPIEDIAAKVKANVDRNYLNTTQLESSFDNEFDKEIEALISKAMSKYSGKMAGQIIESIFSSNSEEAKDFKFRMENLEQDIEAYVEGNANALEIKAKSLCKDFASLAKHDEQLEKVTGFPNEGIIRQGAQNGLKMSNLDIY